jgi:hypothetical protein
MRDRIRNILTEAMTFKDRPNINDAFWKWFGNSKVVDSNGDPLIVYHGTNQKFNQFDPNAPKIAFHKEKGTFFFSSNIKAANAYGETRSFFLSISKPLVLDALDHFTNTPKPIWTVCDDDTIKYAKENGHDGIIVENVSEISGTGAGTTYIAFQSTQIKSIENIGTWNPNDKDIMK